MSNLTTRLRSGFGGIVPTICDEAANEIDRLNGLLATIPDSRPYRWGSFVEWVDSLLIGSHWNEEDCFNAARERKEKEE